MKILIISTGDELLKGQITDTNAAWMAAEIYSRGHRIERVVTVGDDMDALVEIFSHGLNHYDLTLAGGGLGPTVDDLTAEAAAKAIGVSVVHMEEAEAVVRRRFVALNRKMPAINLKQAMLPQGATVIDNPVGTAPGFSLEKEGRTAVFMPGVPAELKPMFLSHVVPLLPPATTRHQRIYKFFGMGESAAQEHLAPVFQPHPELNVSFRVSFPEIALTLTASDSSILESIDSQVMKALAGTVFSRSLISLPEAVLQALTTRGMTLATAESCTGGFLSSTLTDLSGASAVFQGSVVAYANRIKMQLLGVSETDLLQHGAVSEPVARAMAEGVRERFKVDFGIGITGIAGPDGGTAEKPIGTVHIAVATKDRIIHGQCAFTGYNRIQVKAAATWTALKMLLDRIEDRS